MISSSPRSRWSEGSTAFPPFRHQLTIDDQTHYSRFSVSSRDGKFQIGQVVRHRVFPFRGVIFDVDPVFNHTEEWWLSIPESVRPRKDQPFYHLLAENEDSYYTAYVSEQNLLADGDAGPVGHPDIRKLFGALRDGIYEPRLHDLH